MGQGLINTSKAALNCHFPDFSLEAISIKLPERSQNPVCVRHQLGKFTEDPSSLALLCLQGRAKGEIKKEVFEVCILLVLLLNLLFKQKLLFVILDVALKGLGHIAIIF